MPSGCWGKEQSIKTIANFARTVPDMQFDIKEVLVAGNRVVVRGAVSGTPSGDFFGVPHTGKRFRIMAIDIQTIEDGRIARTFQLEKLAAGGWAIARQVSRASGNVHSPAARWSCFGTGHPDKSRSQSYCYDINARLTAPTNSFDDM